MTKRKLSDDVDERPMTSLARGGSVGGGDNSTDDGNESGGEKKKRKKARTTFTGRQIFELERQFEQKKYLSSSERAEMATLLSVTETQVRDPPPPLRPPNSAGWQI